jgi:hypothetical protein
VSRFSPYPQGETSHHDTQDNRIPLPLPAHFTAQGKYQAYWDAAARKARGDAVGTRALIEVLLAHRTLPAGALITAMTRAVEVGVLDPQVVLIDARREANGHVAAIIPIGALARYDRPAPTLSGYDDLLTGSGR